VTYLVVLDTAERHETVVVEGDADPELTSVALKVVKLVHVHPVAFVGHDLKNKQANKQTNKNNDDHYYLSMFKK
jgi:hypothetical protein